jgi:cytoskeleton protein RodZ
MNFEELGLTLQSERERKGLSIEVVMEATKISRTNIVAMEGGDRSALPHPVYAKGFVRSYARYLGLDADELCMVVDREFQDQSEEVADPGYEVSPAAEKAFQEKEGGEGRKKKKTWPLLLLLVIIVGIAAFVFLGLKGKDVPVKTQPDPVAEQVETAPPAPDTAEEPVVDSSEAESEAPAVPAPAVGETDSPEQAVAQEAEDVEEAAPATPPAAEEEKAEPLAVPEEADQADNTAVQPEKQKYDHILIIRATTEKGCWVGVWKEDETKMARDFVLKQGEPLRLMFNLPRRVRIGNASGVTVSYNGKPYPLDLTRGNIQTLTFGFE